MTRTAIVWGINNNNTLGLIRGLGFGGYKVILLLESADQSFCYLRFSKYIQRIHHLKSMDDGIHILLDLREGINGRIPVLCGSDRGMAMLDANYEVLKNSFLVFNVRGRSGLISYYMDKFNTFPIAEKCGLTTIKTWRVSDVADLPANLPYPCLIKGNSSLGCTKNDMFVCRTEDDLRAHLQHGKDMLVQEFIDKEYEIDVNGISINHGKDILIPGVVRKIRDHMDRQSDYIVLENVPTELDVKSIRRFVEVLGFEGLFSIELIKRGDQYYFLEINLRNDGVNYLYTLGGVNMPCLWAQYAFGEVVGFSRIHLELKTPLFLMQLFDLANLKNGDISFGRWFADFRRVNAHFILSIQDPKPFLFYLWIYVRQGFKRLLRMSHLGNCKRQR